MPATARPAIGENSTSVSHSRPRGVAPGISRLQMRGRLKAVSPSLRGRAKAALEGVTQGGNRPITAPLNIAGIRRR